MYGQDSRAVASFSQVQDEAQADAEDSHHQRPIGEKHKQPVQTKGLADKACIEDEDRDH